MHDGLTVMCYLFLILCNIDFYLFSAIITAVKEFEGSGFQ